MASEEHEQELLDYEDDEPTVVTENADSKKANKDSYVSMHISAFRDFLLKPELLRAIADCGFEHPSQIQHECIPQAIIGMDVLGQAKSGMGKTAVFVLSTLQQIDADEELSRVIILCHTRELAFQISKEYERFTKYMNTLKVKVFYGGVPIRNDTEYLKNNTPQIIVGTPGRILDLVKQKALSLSNIKHFVVDECDKVVESVSMRGDVQQIFKTCPREKQVMFFSATLNKEIVDVCKKFMKDPLEIIINDSKLTLHGLKQHYIKLNEKDKNKHLFDLLDELQFNQVIIFVKSVQRCVALCNLLCEQNFPAIDIHRQLTQEERIARYESFKNFEKRILVATNIFGRGIDIERVNIVFNYDMPEDSDTYLHRVARAGRFGTKGLAVTFVSDESDVKILNEVQERFVVSITALPPLGEITNFMEEH